MQICLVPWKDMAALTSGEAHGDGDDGDYGDGSGVDLYEVAQPEVGFDPTRTTDENPRSRPCRRI